MIDLISNKQFLNAAAVALTVYSFIPYTRSIFKGQTKPHVFSWLIWGLATLIVFAAQLADGAGVGAWSTAVSGVGTLYIAYLAFQRRADHSVTRMDWIFLALALASLPLWLWTSDPLWAVIILTTVDTLGFGPTFRKAYHAPYEEQLQMYILLIFRNLLSIAALENYSWTTVLFPAFVSWMCVLFIAMVMVRRARRVV